MGIGGAPEGVISAAAVRCLGGYMQGRLVEFKPGDRERAEKMGMSDWDRIYAAENLAPGENLLFAATGVTDDDFLTLDYVFGREGNHVMRREVNSTTAWSARLSSSLCSKFARNEKVVLLYLLSRSVRLFHSKCFLLF